MEHATTTYAPGQNLADLMVTHTANEIRLTLGEAYDTEPADTSTPIVGTHL